MSGVAGRGKAPSRGSKLKNCGRGDACIVPLPSSHGIFAVGRFTAEETVPLQTKAHFTPEEYLELERKAEYKSEYFAGEIFAMAGASPEHCLITANVTAALGAQLRDSPRTAYSSDMKVRSTEELYTYPDL